MIQVINAVIIYKGEFVHVERFSFGFNDDLFQDTNSVWEFCGELFREIMFQKLQMRLEQLYRV